jgi:hypothetical protein
MPTKKHSIVIAGISLRLANLLLKYFSHLLIIGCATWLIMNKWFDFQSTQLGQVDLETTVQFLLVLLAKVSAVIAGYYLLSYLFDKVPLTECQRRASAIHEVGHLFSAHIGGRDRFYSGKIQISVTRKGAVYKPGRENIENIESEPFDFIEFTMLATIGGYVAQREYAPRSFAIYASLHDWFKYFIVYFTKNRIISDKKESLRKNIKDHYQLVKEAIKENEETFLNIVDELRERGSYEIRSLEDAQLH